jgi:ABC-type bacteriocin/lantibiotic exporter with double-glycine peptidase domain
MLAPPKQAHVCGAAGIEIWPLHIHALLVGLFLLFAFLRAIIHIALHNVMPGIELVLRYEQILHTLQTAVDDGEKKYTAELNATMGRGSKSAGRPYQDHLCGLHASTLLQVSISVALAATAEPLVGGIMLASGLTSFLVTRTQLRSQDGVRVGIARKKSHLDGSMTELLRGKPIVRTLNAVELEVSRVRREATDLSKIERRHHRTMGLFDAGKMTIQSIFGVGVVLLGVNLVIRGSSARTVLNTIPTLHAVRRAASRNPSNARRSQRGDHSCSPSLRDTRRSDRSILRSEGD